MPHTASQTFLRELFIRSGDIPTVLEEAGIPGNVGVAIEIKLPQTDTHVDFIVTCTGQRGGSSLTSLAA
jgi:hypothetical protein